MKGEGGQAQGEVKEMVVSVCKALPRNAITPNSLEGSKKRPDTYFERCTEEKKDVKKSAENLTFASPSTICQWVLLAEDPGAGDPCSEAVWLCSLAYLSFCSVLLLGETVHSGCWLLGWIKCPIFIHINE